MVHTSVENKYEGPTNKTNTGVQIPNQIFANLSFILYSDLSQTTRDGREQTRLAAWQKKGWLFEIFCYWGCMLG